MTKDYLQQSIFFFRSNFNTLLSIQLPFLILLMFLQMSTAAGIEDSENMQSQLLLLTATDLLFVPIYLGATLFYMQGVVDGRTLTPVQTWLMGLRCWGRLFGTFLLSALVTAFGLMLLILPGVYAGVRLALANAICVLEGKGPVQAMKISWDGSDGLFWTLFRGLALIYGGLFLIEVMLSPLLDPGSMIAMLLAVVLDFFNVLGTIFVFRVYRAWRDREAIEEEPLI